MVVGQSVFSAHLASMLGDNHGYFDPSVSYQEEMRKQIESLAGKIVLTEQEAPETSKRKLSDLLKKMASADGMAGRRPYGIITRMFDLMGWKRHELNRMMTISGVTEKNF